MYLFHIYYDYFYMLFPKRRDKGSLILTVKHHQVTLTFLHHSALSRGCFCVGSCRSQVLFNPVFPSLLRSFLFLRPYSNLLHFCLCHYGVHIVNAVWLSFNDWMPFLPSKLMAVNSHASFNRSHYPATIHYRVVSHIHLLPLNPWKNSNKCATTGSGKRKNGGILTRVAHSSVLPATPQNHFQITK